MRPLAVLRPEPGASATVERARTMGLQAFALPLFVIEPIDSAVPELNEFDGLLLTSANAIRSANARLAEMQCLPAYAVGPATAAAAREAGLTLAAAGSGGIDELLGELPPGLRLLHLCGEDRREPVSSAQQITALPVYRSVPVADPLGVDRLRGTVALVHSPRAGQRLAEIAPAKHSIAVAAISPAAAESCGPGWGQVATAEWPRDDALLSLGARLCKHSLPE